MNTTIGIIILIVAVLLLLAGGAYIAYQWIKANGYPDSQGKKFVFERNGYKATVIIDDGVESNKFGQFLCFNDETNVKNYTLVSGAELAEKCWLSIKSINDAYSKLEPGLDDKKKLKNCYFYYMANKKFDATGWRHYGPSVEFVNAYTNFVNRYLKEDQYCAFIRDRYMFNSIETGGITIHEFLHAFSHKKSNNWDHKHNLFHKPLNENPEQIALEIFKVNKEI